MIAADKNLLQASLTQGVLQIQTSLIDLYTKNLNSIGTLAALVAGFAYTGIAEADYTITYEGDPLIYFYFLFDALCLTMGVFCISQATIVTMYGPSLALNGESADAVTTAVGHMCEQQAFTFMIGAISVTSLIISACVLTWARREAGVGAMCMAIYIVIYVFMLHEGKKAYELFKTEEEDAETAKASGVTAMKYKQMGVEMNAKSKGSNLKAKSVNANKETGPESNSSTAQLSTADNKLIAIANTKARGILFWRKLSSTGNGLIECYAVLEKGMLDFYKKEKDFLDHLNPINPKPFKLWEFKLELDYKKFVHDSSGFREGIRGSMLGQSDFSAAQLIASSYNLKEASRKYKFALLPKVLSELAALETLELMATDQESYQAWTRSFEKVIKAQEEMRDNEVLMATSTSRVVTKVEAVVQAANLTSNE